MAAAYAAGAGHGVRLALAAVRRFGLDDAPRALADPAAILLIEHDLDAAYADPDDGPRETADERAARVFGALPTATRQLLAARDPKRRRAGAVRAAETGVTERVLALILEVAGEPRDDAKGVAGWAVRRARRNAAEATEGA